MALSARSCRLTDLSCVDVRDHLRRDNRLLVPVGTCDQYGPHLPLGCGSYVAEAVVEELAADFGVLRAPVLPFGVNLPAERDYAGAAGLREKTLHSMVNDLLAGWEDHGFAEFILITAHRYDPHVEAIATVSGTRARVRVIEVMELDFSGILDGRGGPEHGGEVMTSLMLYLHPDKVNLGRAEDFFLTPTSEPPPRRLTKLPELSPGNVGQPSLATREKGEALFGLITRKIREKVFLSPEEEG